MARVVALQHVAEAAVQLQTRVVRMALLGPRRFVPALHPQQQRREEVALEVDAARVRRPARLGGQQLDRRFEATDLAGGRPHRLHRAAADQPRRVGGAGRVAVQQLVAEAHDRAVQAARALEHVHLSPADQRDRVRLDV
jgi:hypothetical protein